MDCKRFEGLLTDFIEDELDPSEMEAVKRHLLTCPHCSREVEEYKEIRRIFNEEISPQPSPQVLARLSKAAREGVAKDGSPFWKRWFYSPILVPILSSALALFVWISYGEKKVDLLSTSKDMYPTEVMAKKIPAAEETLGVKESRRKGVLSDDLSSVSPQASRGESRIQASAPESAPAKEPLLGEDVKEVDKSSEYRDEAFAGFEAKSMNEPAPKQKAETEVESLEREIMGEGRLEEEETQEEESGKKGDLYSYKESKYYAQLDLALKQQNEGNCEASIETNEELLGKSPPPPDTVKEKAYLSLAECYEQKKDLNNAIISYQNLQEVAPGQTAFAKEKIEGLRQKANFKVREVEPSDTEEGLKAE